MKKTITINVQWVVIGIVEANEESYVSLTDIARYKNIFQPADVIKNWLRLKSTIDFLWLWESINNSDFKGVEFDQFKNEAGNNYFVLSPQKWIEKTQAKWLITKSWRYGWWTFAHKDIAFEFASRISPEFKIYLIREFQRLKEQELKWLDRNVKRFLTKMNYRIHTDAIQEYLIPSELSPEKINFIYWNQHLVDH